MVEPRSVEWLTAQLENHSRVLRHALRLALVERTFPTHLRFQGRDPPRLDEGDALGGLRIEYSFPDWVPRIAGLSPAGAIKCGARHPFGLGCGSLFDSDLGGADPELVGKLVEAWVSRIWREVRHLAPDLRGYVSVHDSFFWTDLDTGEVVSEQTTGLGWL